MQLSTIIGSGGQKIDPDPLRKKTHDTCSLLFTEIYPFSYVNFFSSTGFAEYPADFNYPDIQSQVFSMFFLFFFRN